MKLNITEILNYRTHGATSTLLEFENFKVLLDCGLYDRKNFEEYEKYRDKLTKLDFVLLSRADRPYSGALIHLVTMFDFKGAIYTTLPVKYLCSFCNQIFYFNNLSRNEVKSEEVRDFFQQSYNIYDQMIELRYKQKYKTEMKGKKVKIEAYCCGNSIGASFWKIIVERMVFGYLVEYNHQTELHLEGYNPNDFSNISFDVLITSSFNCMSVKRGNEEKVKELQEKVKSTKDKGGNLLILCNCLTRFLELILLLEEKIFAAGKPKDTKLIIFTSMNQYLEIMKILSEFMNPKLSSYIFGDEKKFLFFKYCRSSEFEEFFAKEASTNDIILSITEEVIMGRQHKLLQRFGSNPNNEILFFDGFPACFDQEKKVFKKKENRARVDVENLLEYKNTLETQEAEQNELEDLETAEPSLIGDELSTTAIEPQPENNTQIEEVLFGINNGFYFFSHKMANLHGTSFGRPLGDKTLSDLKKVSLVTVDTVKTSLEANFQNQQKNFDFYDDLVAFENLPDELPAEGNISALNFTGLSEGYSMEIILRSLKANLLIFINGSDEESKHLISTDLQKRKKRALLSDKKYYKGFLARTSMKATFEDTDPDDLEFKYLRDDIISYVPVKASIRIKRSEDDYASKGKAIDAKTEVRIAVKHHESRVQSLGKRGSQKKEASYSSLDKFRLIEFKSRLEQEGIESTLEVGRLNINNKVYVVQSKGKLLLDGMFSEEFFKVRKILYKDMMIMIK